MSERNDFNQLFLTPDADSKAMYTKVMASTQAMLVERFANLPAYSGKSPEAVEAELKEIYVNGAARPFAEVLKEVGETVVQNMVNVNHPRCFAHLHCPPLIPAIAAEMIASTTNQSMDSWDQSGAATFIDQHMVDRFCELYQLGNEADGIFTSGGTQSNFMALLLARDAAAQRHFNWSFAAHGNPPEGHRFRILCSTECHFSLRQSARILGMGDQSIVPIAVNAERQLTAEAVRKTVHELEAESLIPIALITTAGTTDFGIISDIQALGECAADLGLWYHVDAAFGSGLIFSPQHRDKLAGIELADSLTVDFHKLFYQPISCGLFLLKKGADFDLIRLHADYLNPESNEEAGIPDLVVKSIQTTRRFDSLKIYMTLRTVGEETLGRIIDTVLSVTKQTADQMEATPNFELALMPTLNAVVFRYCPPPPTALAGNEAATEAWLNQINEHIRRMLFNAGQAVISQTVVDDRLYLKLTIMNPLTTMEDTKDLLTMISQIELTGSPPHHD